MRTRVPLLKVSVQPRHSTSSTPVFPTFGSEVPVAAAADFAWSIDMPRRTPSIPAWDKVADVAEVGTAPRGTPSVTVVQPPSAIRHPTITANRSQLLGHGAT